MRALMTFFTLLVALWSPAVAGTRAQSLLADLPLYFVENGGQEDAWVAYYVPGKNITTYFTADGVTFAFSSPTSPPSRRASRAAEPLTRERWALKLDFVGATPVMPRGQDLMPTIFSYFKGPESEWKTGLRTYANVVYRDLWPGIDLVWESSGGRLKYTFRINKGSDPSNIKLAYRGATSVVLDRGRLEVATPLGGFTDDRPYAYQDLADGRRVEIPARYAKAAGQHGYGFDVGEYDHSRTLVLDPGFFVYSGYIGGSAQDSAAAIAVDSAGNAYVAGFTFSTVPSFPGTVGPDLSQNGSMDAFVAKVKADGTGYVYAGFIGGSGTDLALGVAVDSSGNAYVAGRTISPNFPLRGGPVMPFSGQSEAFVTKVNAAGNSLVYSFLIGGTGVDQANAIAVDVSGNAYVAGETESDETTFPVKGGPGLIHRGLDDAFVAKVKADGSALVYLGYIGGEGGDSANAIAVDSAGNAYVAGSTSSDQASFPAKGGPHLRITGPSDAFVAKVKPDGTLVYAGYIGGAGAEVANAIAVDSTGAAYVAGFTTSDETTFPVQGGPDRTFNGGHDAFVAKVKPDGSALVYAGYIGGSGDDEALAIDVDAAGNAYVAGVSNSTSGFPIRVGPDLFNNGAHDAFVAKVKPDGSGLLFAGFIGGAADDFANGIAVDSSGNVYLAGETHQIFSSGTAFPVIVGPDLIYNGGAFDAFVVKLSGKPDLQEGALTIPGFAKPGGSFTVTSTATNLGLGTAPASTTRYYLSTDPVKSAGDILLGGSKSVGILVPGAIVSGSATVTVPANTATGSYFVLACADDAKAIAELAEDNCAASATTVALTLPDLVVTALTYSFQSKQPGQTFSIISETTANQGHVSAGASTTRYYLQDRNSGARTLLAGTRSVTSLAPSGSSTGTVTVTIPTTTPLSSYVVQACADDTSAVAEVDETNNCLTGINVVTVSRPDLRVTLVSSQALSATPGQSINVTDTVRNVSDVTAAASTIRYYLSVDDVKSTDDILLTGSRTVSALSGFSENTGTVSVTIPTTTPGNTYLVLACADDSNVVVELSETNNCRATRGSVVVSGTGTFELSPTSATVLPDELLLYRFKWITPGVWRDLASLDLRFVGASDGKTIFWVRWDQASDTFTLVDTDGTATGRPAVPGSSETLLTGNAVLHLDQTTVVPGGPTAPDVTLTLAMSFKSEAAGQVYRDYRVEVNATDDFGRTQGFAQGGTLRVQRTAPASTTLAGSVSGVASGTDNGSLRLQGKFTAADPVALNEATLTLTALLDEVGGAGEIVRGAGGAALLPVTLAARGGGKTTDAIYEAPSGVRPTVWAELKVRDAARGLMEFYIKVDRATLTVGPALCSGGSSPATQLRTTFSVQAAGAAAGVDVTLPWRCLGTQLKTP